jgi:hypothetical protein
MSATSISTTLAGVAAARHLGRGGQRATACFPGMVIWAGCLLVACSGPDRKEDMTAGASQAIINGTSTQLYPELATVGSAFGDCTGTLIAEKLVLTAAHCISGANAWNIFHPASGTMQFSTCARAHPDVRSQLARDRGCGRHLAGLGHPGPATVPLQLQRSGRVRFFERRRSRARGQRQPEQQRVLHCEQHDRGGGSEHLHDGFVAHRIR